MLAEFKMKLDTDQELSVQKSSLFHGALMELLTPEYTDYLHESRLHPYAQHLERKDGEWYWVVSTLNTEAKEQIIDHTLAELQKVKIDKIQAEVTIAETECRTLAYKDLARQFYMTDSSRYINLHFCTPVSFKQKGRYLIYPDIRCIYQSLMSKYDAATSPGSMLDEETLEQLCEDTKIIQYDLKSTSFALEGVRIPSFIGRMKIKLDGTQTLANFANMLFEFGTFSGVGVKNSLGMGAFHILEGRKE